MKIRNGFVSNSSSSSFVGFGVCTYEDELFEALEKMGKEIDREDWDFLYLFCEKEGLEMAHLYDECIIGFRFSEMMDDETKAQFRERTKEAIRKVFGPEIAEQMSEMNEAWRDG